MATELTAERLRELLDYDRDTGLFTWRTTKGQMLAGATAGYREPGGYVRIHTHGRLHVAHRLAFLHVTGAWPEGHVDHINHDKVDNRWSNLRDASVRLNGENRKGAQSNSVSGFLGVHWNKQCGRWQAEIRHSGKKHYLGLHDTPEAAYAAYLAAKRQHHKGNTL